MLWMLLVYVVASNGFNSPPTISSSFHGATFATKEACQAAAQTVSLYSPKATEDEVSKSGLVMVCAPAQPPPPEPPPPQGAENAVPMQQSPFPGSPLTPPRPGRH